MSLTSTFHTTASTALITAPSTTAASLPTYPFETWMGNNTDHLGYFIPSLDCSAITLAATTLSGSGITEVFTYTEYRNNISHWEDTTRYCRPRVPNSTPGSGEYYYPGTCPYGWTSYVTETTIYSAAPTATALIFQDAMCCPDSYTSHLYGTRYFCTRPLPRRTIETLFTHATTTYNDARYLVITWHLLGSIDSNGVTHKLSSSSTNSYSYETLSEETTLTYWPVFVRSANSDTNAKYAFTPTRTGEGMVQETNPWYHEIKRTTARKETDLIVGVSLAGGSALVGAVVGWVWCWRKKRRRARRRAREWRRRDGEGQKGGRVEGEEEGKPELMGSLYVGPQMRHQNGERGLKPELEGEQKTSAAVVKDVEDTGYQDDGDGRETAHPELDHQTRRHGIADAEFDGREKERRNVELEAGKTRERRIARKELPANTQPRTGPSSTEIYPQSPVLSGPVPDFTVIYPAASDPEALEEERKLEMQGERLRERREQLAREEEAWKMKLAQRGSASPG